MERPVVKLSIVGFLVCRDDGDEGPASEPGEVAESESDSQSGYGSVKLRGG